MASNQDVKITLYWLENSRAQRIVWLLEELRLPYGLKMFKRMKDMQADAQLKEIHPLGKSPVVTVETPYTPKPLVLAESGVIVGYLIDCFGSKDTLSQCERFRPGCDHSVGRESEAWMREQYFMHYVEGSLMPFLQLEAVVSNIRNAPVPFFIKPVTRMISNKVYEAYLGPNLRRHLDFLEEQIESSPEDGRYLCGNQLSGADILVVYALEVEEANGLLNQKDYPRLTAYLRRLRERDGFKQATAKVESAGGSTSPLPRQ
uniref:Glutathione S-transferase III n=1 Tax=Coccidioides posadasii RMSCC 3488 TaxID=454284 RepID=A0A0J6FPJ9_COCPO|nr:glutathione S-transferase III [Coccidioides posadasii RMSCC 3488]